LRIKCLVLVLVVVAVFILVLVQNTPKVAAFSAVTLAIAQFEGHKISKPEPLANN